MALTPGTRLGPYEIQSLLGAGGMGEVYRARDTKLNRDVAIKVLPDLVASDPERLARFQREAQVLASLNHPNIAAIYGLEETDGVKALVLELVEGPTLADRIAQSPLPLDEALPIARQIAEALEAAHEQGIIHRDLKPSNIKLRPDGTVKVLDFGLAKALAPEPGSAAAVHLSHSPTITSPAMMTGVGLILGTAAYMSPEQAKGRAADKRSDVWAFGCVLYEMLTGRRAFDGDDMTDVLGAVVRLEPNWAALPSEVPLPVRTLIQSCLVKDRRRRVADISTALFVLDKAASLVEPAPPSASASVALGRTAAIAMVAAALAGVGVWMVSRTTPETTSAQVARLTVTLPDNQRFNDRSNPALAISPQGTLIAYVATSAGRSQLHVRAIDSGESKALAGTELASNPFFSPDGQWIGFFAQGKLKKVSVAAGTSQTLCDVLTGRGGSWAADNSIYFAAGSITGLSRVSADGGSPTEVTRLDRANGEVSHRWPQVLPGGNAVMFSVWTGPAEDEQEVQVLNLDTGERTVVVRGGQTGSYAPSGHVIYVRNDELFALPFDLDGLEVSGQSMRLGDAVWEGGEGAHYAVSDTGTLVYLPGNPHRYERRLVWVGRDGGVEPLPVPARRYQGNAVISPDGQRAAVDIEAGTIGVWLYDFSRATLTPLTTGSGSSQSPRWTPDGTRIVYRGTRTGFRNLWWKTVDAAVAEERLTTGEGNQTPGSWSADGQWLVYYDGDPVTGSDIWARPSSGDHKPRVVVRTPAAEFHPRLSPDGRWLAYTSDESGRVEVFVQPFPEPAGRTLISTSGGVEPVWSRDGRELFYLNGDAMMAVQVKTSPTFTAGTPRILFEGRFLLSPTNVASYDVTADGQRFLRVQPMHPDPPTNQIQVVLNWFEELRRVAPGS